MDLVQRWVDRCRALMWDISTFMKLVKQRFTMHFNQKHELEGTLWESRFHSTLIEGMGDAMAAVAAYIELNPVRAGLVSDPADYKWSSYAEAFQGNVEAVESIRTIVAGAQRVAEEKVTADEAMKSYRGLLYGNFAKDSRGWAACELAMESKDANPGDCPADRAQDSSARPKVILGPTKAEILEKVLGHEHVTLEQFIRIRVRYFKDGAALGSKEFVEGIVQELKRKLRLKEIQSGTPLLGLDPKKGLFSLKNLRNRLFG